MHFEQWKLLHAMALILSIFLSAVISDDESARPSNVKGKKSKLADIGDEEIHRKLKQKKLVTLLVNKPDECDVLSEKHDEVQVHYTGYLETGEVFDSSENAGKDPISFILGSGQVIKGWDEGLLNMCPGEKRRLIIPPDLGYGKTGFPPVIPPDATLLFEVTLVNLRKQSFGTNFADPQNLLQFAKFLFIPGVILYVFYYLYKRYKDEEAQKSKDSKHSSRGKNIRKRK